MTNRGFWWRLMLAAVVMGMVGCTPAADGGDDGDDPPETDGMVDMTPPDPDMAVPDPDMAVPDPDMAALDPDMAVLDPDMAAPDPDMAVLDPDMAVLEHDIALPPECEGPDDCDPGELCEDGTCVPGPVCEDDAFEDNDRAIDGTPVEGLQVLPVGEATVDDLRLCGGDDDVFAIDGCADGRLGVVLRFTHADGDLTLRVTDLRGDVIAESATAEDVEAVEVDLDPDAPLFAVVSGAPGVATDYALDFTRTCPACVIDADCERGELCDGLGCVPGECRGDENCPGGVCLDAFCVECAGDDDCGEEVCVDNACVGCGDDADCPGGVCENAECVQCAGDDDCGEGVCAANVCVGCRGDRDCPAGVCVDEVCVGCRGDGDCPGGVCDDGACVQCVDDADCPDGVCIGQLCAQCRGDGDCPDGVCVDQACVECDVDDDCAEGVCVGQQCAQCRDNENCPGGVCVDGICLGCGGDGDCPGGVCVDDVCVECRDDGGCPDGVCEAEVCIECRADGDCGAGVCVDAVCVQCRENGDCDGGVCADAVCVECAGDGDCPDGVCRNAACVECAADDDCADGVCQANACVPCVADDDCPDGVCEDNICVECRADGDCGPGATCVEQTCAADPCAEPIPLLPDAPVEGSTAGLTNARSGSCGGDGAPEAIHLFVAPGGGPWCLSTVGSGYDTVLHVREAACDGLEVACNDDSDDFDGTISSVTLQAEADAAYIVFVDGWNDRSGEYLLTATPGQCGEPPIRGPAPGELVITEFIQDPSAVTDANGEWFEVFSAADEPLELRGVRFVEADGGNEWFVEDSLVVEPGSYTVFGKNPDPETNGGVAVDYAFGGQMALGNGADDIEIRNVDDALIDAVAWDGGDVWPDPTGASTSLGAADPTAVDNSDGALWCPGSTPYGDGDQGSPGAPNPPCP